MTGSNDDECGEDRSKVARRRWKILAEALQRSNQRDASPDSASTRKFQSFGLLSFEPLDHPKDPHLHTATCINSHLTVTVRLMRRDFSPSQLTGFNNTGNVCIWPSEEVLTYYCLNNLNIFEGKNVLELGGGMTCLAGMMVAASGVPSQVVVTDGNALSVSNVKHALHHNTLTVQPTCRVLRWGMEEEMASLKGKVDVAMCADCLFFDDGRESLVRTLVSVLVVGGRALVVAPARSGTFHSFAALCRPHFTVAMVTQYDKIVHQHVSKSAMDPHYSENLHFPLLMILQKLPIN